MDSDSEDDDDFEKPLEAPGRAMSRLLAKKPRISKVPSHWKYRSQSGIQDCREHRHFCVVIGWRSSIHNQGCR